MSDGMGREFTYLSSHATNRYFIPNWGIQCKPSVNPVLQGPPKLLERFSKSYRNLQDSWNKSRILGGF